MMRFAWMSAFWRVEVRREATCWPFATEPMGSLRLAGL